MRCIDCGAQLKKPGAVRCRYHAAIVFGGKRRGTRAEEKITHAMVTAATRKFLRAGGLVTKLPDERVPRRHLNDDGCWELI